MKLKRTLDQKWWTVRILKRVKFVGGLGIVLIIGLMLQQSVSDDVNEYYWAVEADEDLPFESERIL